MPDKNPNTHDSDDKAGKRNLPSWMSSRDSGEKLLPKKPTGGCEDNEGGRPEKGTAEAKPCKGASISKQTKNNQPSASGSKVRTNVDTLSFSNLLEGVVFVLSGFVNPERSKLRSQAQEMGAEYQPDWNSSSTLLICAFPNTPKFRQVEADCGTIVSKEWISECYNQKKLVAIETYLMHAGKPWRKSNISQEGRQASETTPPEKPQKQAGRSLPSKPSVGASSKVGAPSHIKESLSTPEVIKWAANDLNETVSWLQSQEESPEPSEVKKIAAEGILTCLQDAIESLEKNQEISQAIEQWKFVPRVVKELAKLEDLKTSKTSVKSRDIYEQALRCKHIYETEFYRLDEDSSVKKKRPMESTDTGYDSDETVEMTEDEIDLAYKSISSKLGK